jgi:hypothetical protein
MNKNKIIQMSNQELFTTIFMSTELFGKDTESMLPKPDITFEDSDLDSLDLVELSMEAEVLVAEIIGIVEVDFSNTVEFSMKDTPRVFVQKIKSFVMDLRK